MLDGISENQVVDNAEVNVIPKSGCNFTANPAKKIPKVGTIAGEVKEELRSEPIEYILGKDISISREESIDVDQRRWNKETNKKMK